MAQCSFAWRLCPLLILLLLHPTFVRTHTNSRAKRIQVKPGGHVFTVEGDVGKGLPEEELDFNPNLAGSLAKTGDYKITVATFDQEPRPLTLTVRVY